MLIAPVKILFPDSFFVCLAGRIQFFPATRPAHIWNREHSGYAINRNLPAAVGQEVRQEIPLTGCWVVNARRHRLDGSVGFIIPS